ncbi:CD1375 family protein [uncultured Anaerococcus sp.]|uniref:CD1375 family protein n=1 Tax=uncultured Anaerococcus sp. TaxID=293428 RepID=UPI00262BC814|nr:CD1375 family protein [uncultured Anaerococcus sp.]
MAKIYVRLITRGLKTFEDIPEWYRENVYQELVNQGLEDLAIIDGKPYKED